MLTIQLIVTGKTEDGALDRALRAVFPATRDGIPVVWRAGVIVPEPAATRLVQVAQSPAANMKTLAKAMLNTLNRSPHTGQPPPNLVLAIGDVELHNLGQEALLVDHLRVALQQEANNHPAASLLRDRCAYHLLRPMVEATFFGDPATLGRAGVGVLHQQQPLRVRDVEGFESIDTDAGWVAHCDSKRRRHAGEPWWRPERHAADYLDHLTRRAGGARYRKVHEGVNALASVPWVNVVDTEPSPYLRALFDDVSAWFGTPSPLRRAFIPAPLAPTHPDATAPADRLLRNL